MGVSLNQIPNAQQLGTQALNESITMLGKSQFATPEQYQQSVDAVNQGLTNALSQLNSTLTNGVSYSQTYNQSAIDNINSKYQTAKDAMAQAKAAQADAMKTYTNLLGIPQPTQAVEPSTYQAGKPNVT